MMEIWNNKTPTQPDIPLCGYSVDLHRFEMAGMAMANIMGADKPFRELSKHIDKLPIAEQYEAKQKLSKFVTNNSFVSEKLLSRQETSGGHSGHQDCGHSSFAIFPFFVFVQSFVSVTVTVINNINNNNNNNINNDNNNNNNNNHITKQPQNYGVVTSS